ncbi:DUF2537 domain-containing protein [Salinifilum ghardaiensis]
MSSRTAGWELAADERGAVLRRAGREYDPSALPLSGSVVRALREWAEVVADLGGTAAGPGGPGRQDASATGAAAEREMTTGVATGEPATDEAAAAVLTDRSRALAARVAAELGAEVDCADPLSGRVLRAGPETSAQQPAGEPVPWGPGLFVSLVLGAIVTVVLVVVSRGLADVSAALAVIVNLAVAAGFAPSVWVGSGVPTWRWVAWGTGGGVLAAWAALLLSLLGG